MAWITPVTDRTLNDVLDAKRNQTGMLGKKGAMDYPDLNRIEDNYKYLMGLLNGSGYYNQFESRNVTETWIVNGVPMSTTYTDWQKDNIFFKPEADRIRRNLNKLSQIYLKGLGLPELDFLDSLNYIEANQWENIELETYKAYSRMIDGYKYCGTQISGGVTL